MSTRQFEDDPRLTAYALGELEAEEARQVEAMLAEDAGARALVEEIRATALRLTDALRAEGATALSSALAIGREPMASAETNSAASPEPGVRGEKKPWRIADAQEPDQAADWRKRRWRWHHALAAAASLVVVGLVGWSIIAPSLERARDSVGTIAQADGRERLHSSGGAVPFPLTEGPESRDLGGLAPLPSDEAVVGSPAQRMQQPAQPQQDALVATLEKDQQDAIAAGNPAAAKALSDQIEALKSRTGPAQMSEVQRALRQEAAQIDRERASLGAPSAQKGGAAQHDAASPVPAEAAPGAEPATPQSRGQGFGGGDARGGGAFGGGGKGKTGGGGAGGFGGAGGEKEEHADDDARPGIDMIGATELNVPATQALNLRNRYRDDFNTEQYDLVVDNAFKRVADEPLSTFSVDVDTASYANVRRFLTAGRLPPPDAVRIEELVNYFDYAYEPPSTQSEHPFAASVAVSEAPWNPEHRLVRIGIKGKEVLADERPPSNLVFLLDVSGSMQPQNKLPLVKRAMTMLAEQLDERDRVAIVVYAGSSGLVLPSTSGAKRDLITGALDRLGAGGSTNGGEGIALAYQVARENFIKGGVNRVILCTDGDFNIGVTDGGQLTRLIEEQAKSGVYLSILGFGMGNLKDATMEELTNKGEGNYGYIDTEHEARKLLVEQMQGTLQSIAKDVKIQVEFNPAEIGAYRLIGYENRVLAAQDFNDDTKDAGDIGAGHEVTALYEVVPVEVQAKNVEAEIARLREVLKKYEELQAVAGQTAEGLPPHDAEVKAIKAQIGSLTKSQPAPAVDELKYQEKPAIAPAAQSGELLTVKLRYKGPEAPKEQGTSTLIEFPVKDEPQKFAETDPDFQLAASVAGFGMLLRDSPYKGSLSWAGLEEMTRPLEGFRRAEMEEGSESLRRLEFRELVQQASVLSRKRAEP